MNVSLWSCTFEHTLADPVVLLILCRKPILVQQHKHQYFHKYQIPLIHHCLNQMEMHWGCHSDTMPLIKHDFNEIVKLKISKLKCSYSCLFFIKIMSSCNHNIVIKYSILVEVLDIDVFYQEEWMYHEARTKGRTNINLGVVSLPFPLLFCLIWVCDCLIIVYNWFECDQVAILQTHIPCVY